MRNGYIMAISGSRSFQNFEQFEKTINKVWMAEGIPSLIISGEYHGTDMMAEQLCIKRNVMYERYEAEWSQHGKAAGFIRNELLIMQSDILVAFPSVRSIGTHNAMDMAHAKGMKTYVFRMKD